MNAQHTIDPPTDAPQSSRGSELAYAEYQIRNSIARHWPFPHTIIRPVFREQYFREMLNAFPEDDAFLPLNEYHKDRGAVFLTPDREDGTDDLKQLDEHQRVFWTQFCRTIGDDRFRESLLLLLGGPEFVESHLARTRPLVHLSLDRKGYEIRPHTDIAQKIVTVLFYLPEVDEDHAAQYGTSILSVRPGCEHLDPHDWNRYDTVFTAPFLSNTMLAFRVGDSSWHGVEPIHHPVRRRSIQYFLMLNDD